MLEFRSGGRRVSLEQFFENLKNEHVTDRTRRFARDHG
jgi:hypothetical protein